MTRYPFLGEFFLHYRSRSVYLDKEKTGISGCLRTTAGLYMPTANTSCGFHESQDCGIKSRGNSSLVFSANIFISRSAIICGETLTVQPCPALRGLDCGALTHRFILAPTWIRRHSQCCLPLQWSRKLGQFDRKKWRTRGIST
jgi:hypothetical protein